MWIRCYIVLIADLQASDSEGICADKGVPSIFHWAQVPSPWISSSTNPCCCRSLPLVHRLPVGCSNCLSLGHYTVIGTFPLLSKAAMQEDVISFPYLYRSVINLSFLFVNYVMLYGLICYQVYSLMNSCLPLYELLSCHLYNLINQNVIK